MKIVFLTPGTGSYYCGACMRDNALAKSLHKAGHEVALVPMYLPLQLDEELLEGASASPLFFGGINLWLQQKFALFRHTPEWFDRWFDRPGLLRQVARHSHMTSAREHGEMTLAMLRVGESGFRKELEKLLRWLQAEQPDVVCLSTALQAGMIPSLRQSLGATLVCCFQGEDSFLDALPPGLREQCWDELSARVREADTLVAPSAHYAALMTTRLALAADAIRVIPNGIDLEGYHVEPAKPRPPRLVCLARLIPEKGLGLVVDAFLHLRQQLGHPDARLHLAGTVTDGDLPWIGTLKRKLAAAGLDAATTWSLNVPRGEKMEFLRSLALFSVPAVYQEAFGLYLVEAMASGVPVVQPDAASFREIVGTAGGGVLVTPGDATALARAWHELLADEPRREDLARQARRAAEAHYSVEAMRERFLGLVRDARAKSA